MIKLICLGAVPLLAAYVYGQRIPEPLVPPFHAVEMEDRIFLANLEVGEKASREDMARAERARAAQLQASAPVPVAVAVPAPVAERATAPTVRAEPIPQAEPIPRAIPVRAYSQSVPMPMPAEATVGNTGMNLARNETRAGGEAEVRRAIPVHSSKRASIVIYHGEVFTFQPGSAYSVR